MRIIDRITLVFQHLTIILAIVFIIFTILDWYNPMMAFSSNELSMKLQLLFCISAIFSTVCSLIRKKNR